MSDDIMEKSYNILEIARNIYQINEIFNSNAIFKDNIFIIMEDGKILKEKDFEKTDSSYYFQNSEIEGVIIKNKNSNYSIKAMVKYKYINNESIWFAKIKIENSSNGIQIKGKWGGSWEDPDYEDEDLTQNSSVDFLLALDAMFNHLINIYNHLCENKKVNSDLYNPEWVKKLKPYNTF